MKSSRFYKIIIACLVVLNVGVLSFFWLNKHPKHGPPTPIVEIISFDANVESKVAELEKEHHTKKQGLMLKSRDLHHEFYSDMNRTDEEKVVYLEKIGSIQMEIDEMTYDFFQSIMELCDDDQKMELKKIVEGAIQHFDGPRPPKK